MDQALLIKAIGILSSATVIAAALKVIAIILNNRQAERMARLQSEMGRPLAEVPVYLQAYKGLTDDLTAEIDRLRKAGDEADHRQANNLTLFKDYAEKTGRALWECHEERRTDRVDFDRRLKEERAKRRQLERAFERERTDTRQLIAELERKILLASPTS